MKSLLRIALPMAIHGVMAGQARSTAAVDAAGALHKTHPTSREIPLGEVELVRFSQGDFFSG